MQFRSSLWNFKRPIVKTDIKLSRSVLQCISLKTTTNDSIFTIILTWFVSIVEFWRVDDYAQPPYTGIHALTPWDNLLYSCILFPNWDDYYSILHEWMCVFVWERERERPYTYQIISYLNIVPWINFPDLSKCNAVLLYMYHLIWN